MNITLDYTDRGRRPSAKQILADWKKAGSPKQFEVTYGETYAAFTYGGYGRWYDYGNGCRGVKRYAVVAALNALNLPNTGDEAR